MIQRLLNYFSEQPDGDSSVIGQACKQRAIVHTEQPRSKSFNVWVRYHRIYNGLWRRASSTGI